MEDSELTNFSVGREYQFLRSKGGLLVFIGISKAFAGSYWRCQHRRRWLPSGFLLLFFIYFILFYSIFIFYLFLFIFIFRSFRNLQACCSQHAHFPAGFILSVTLKPSTVHWHWHCLHWPELLPLALFLLLEFCHISVLLGISFVHCLWPGTYSLRNHQVLHGRSHANDYRIGQLTLFCFSLISMCVHSFGP